MRHLRIKILLCCLVVCCIGFMIWMSATLFHQNKLLKNYENGFRLSGTYVDKIVGENTANNSNQKYIVFRDEENHPYSYYTYEQYGEVQSGIWQITSDKNLYILENLKGIEIGFVTVKKDHIFVTIQGKTVKYNKIANDEVRINIKAP